MTNTGASFPRKRVGALLCRSFRFLLIAAAGTSVTAAARTAAAQTKNCGAFVGLWPDGAPQCLKDSNTTEGFDGAACCCRQSPPGVDPEVWTGGCTLFKGGLIVRTSGLRLDHADGRRELVEGMAVVETDPNWQGKVSGIFRLEILGGAEMTTKGRASARLAQDGSQVGLRADEGMAVLTHRLHAATLVVEPGQEVTLDPAEPKTWAQVQVEGEAGDKSPLASGCSAQPRHDGHLSQVALLLFVIVWLARVTRLRRRRG